LRDPKAFGRAVKAAGLGKIEESVEKIDLHGFLPVTTPGALPRTPGYLGRKDDVIGFLDQ
jgi:hypothetical protein